jgi:omega-6 fatty acid desaturase (delta-12 desaturase)
MDGSMEAPMEAVEASDHAASGEEPAKELSPLQKANAARAKATKEGRAVIEATKPYAKENRAESWLHLGVVIGVIGGLTTVAALAPWWPLRLAAAVVSGLTIVRLFIVYHDFMHGALLRGSKVADVILSAYGVLVLAPPRIWKESHNYHHAHTSQIVGSQIGSYPIVTTEMYKRMKPIDRLKYRLARNPLTILSGYVPIFMLGMCLNSVRKSPIKYWDSALALVVNVALTVGLVARFGVATAAFVYLVPLAVACATGAYLFYAQHNFPDMQLQPRHEWTFAKAALESSSYMPMGPVMRWFTGNIGYHHVHHLNPHIPFYKLPKAMAEVPALQNPGVTSLAPWDVARCLGLKLWDPQARKMVGYP